MRVSGIYEIVNTVSNKRYVGSAVDFEKRWALHRHQLANGCHKNLHIQNAWAKYGDTVFEFRPLLRCAPEQLLFYEQRCIDGLKPDYNMCLIAGSALGVKRRPETVAKMVASKLGYRHTTEAKEKMAAAMMVTPMLGRKPTAEARAKMSAAKLKQKVVDK